MGAGRQAGRTQALDKFAARTHACIKMSVAVYASFKYMLYACRLLCCRVAARRKERREARAASEASSDAEDTSTAATPQPDQSVDASTDSDASTSSTTAAPEPKKRGKRGKGVDSEGGEDSEADITAKAAMCKAAAEAWAGEGPVPPELQWRQQVRTLCASCVCW